MHDPRLTGTWRSDKRRTTREILARRDIPGGKRRTTLLNVFGKLTLRYTRTRCYSTFDGSTDVRPLKVVAKDASSVVVIGSGPLGDQDVIYHIHFEGPERSPTPPYYWVSLGGFREYFRRVRARRPTTR
jgi:hypothetical protein